MLLQPHAKVDLRLRSSDQRALASVTLDESIGVTLLLWLTKQPRSLTDVEAAFGLDHCCVIGTMARLIRADLLGITRACDTRGRTERQFFTKTATFNRAIADRGIELEGAGDTCFRRTDFAPGHSVAAHVALATAEGAISADDF